MQSMTELPWTIPFLKIVHDEYSKSPPKYKNEKILDSDVEYILKIASEDDPFDKGGLKKESIMEIQSKRADILKTTCEYGQILVVSFKNSPIKLEWNTWWRAVRLLSPKQQVRILIFGHPRKRVLPSESTHIGPEHLNGGATMRCDPGTIVIYRSEEATRVLLHELFHASCSDPYSKDTPHIEADTEAWAEILLCAMAARGNPHSWNRYMHEQINWALKQAIAIQSIYKIKSPNDYAWRYIIGRLEVWKRLGINIPSFNVTTQYKLSTLRFTICEPKNCIHVEYRNTNYMGVKGLQSFIKQYSVPKTIDDLLDVKNQKLKIGIDISFYIYRWQGDGERIVNFIKSLQQNKQHIILAFDGRAEDGKVWEAQRRREARELELQSANKILEMLDTEELSDEQRFMLERKVMEHQKKGWSLTKDVRNAIKERFYIEKIPMIKAKGEADGLLASMSARGDLDIVISGDMDLLAMGTRVIWTPLEDGIHFREYVRENILAELNMTDWQFRSLCAMCFTEATQEQNNFSIQEAYQMLKVFRSLTVLKQKYPEWLTVWPDDSHIFYRQVDNVEPWIREDQLPIYKAYMNYEPMPYVD